MLLQFWLLSTQFGIDPIKMLRFLRGLPRYVRDLIKWKKMGGENPKILYPILGNWSESSGSCTGHYFHQDLLIAGYIYEAKPIRHIDIGSRIDGFVAHVSVFREIEVIDIRHMEVLPYRIKFLQADLMKSDSALFECCDSLSCLHAIEHFGLGRYGDPVDPNGHLRGFANLITMLKPDGKMYISFPIGQPRIEFNAHRVFGPRDIILWPGSERLELVNFDFVDDLGRVHVHATVDQAMQASLNYGCGIYTFKKTH